ncbi:unnamed protein product [Cryptosporidium hominis]|uniref:TatD related DNase n=1 Tax=Cryptosporidium hominis TaxID=237895 RepID=A0A0S4TGQ4_CRYHO|nr:unnamed protein product [Cryptosporidium hominis]
MEELKFIDIGSNLTDLMFQGIYNDKKQHDSDLEIVIKRAIKGGLDKILITAGSYQETLEALKICEELDPKCKLLFTTVGVHPTRTKDCKVHSDDYLKRMKDLIRMNSSRIKAIGEFGLDSDRLHFSSMKIQEKYFEKQFELLEEFCLPMFLHIRGDQDCYSKFVRIINEKKSLWIKRGGVAHSFTGNLEQLKMILEMDLEIGVNGCSLKTQENLNIVENIPLDKLHIETDSPWCDIKPTHSSYNLIETHFPQVNKPSKWEEDKLIKGRNEPIKIIQVAEILFKIYSNNSKLSFNQFIDEIYKNTFKMYFKAI